MIPGESWFVDADIYWVMYRDVKEKQEINVVS